MTDQELADEIRTAVFRLNALLAQAAANGISVSISDYSVQRIDQPCDARMLTADIRKVEVL